MLKPRIYDNGGKTVDRYTVITDGFVYTMSNDPFSPLGFNQFCCMENELGQNVFKDEKKVKLKDLSKDVKKAIKLRMEAE